MAKVQIGAGSTANNLVGTSGSRGGIRIVRLSTGVIYAFILSAPAIGGTLGWAKSLDGGRTWSVITALDANVAAFEVWYDRWTPGDTTGNLIHIAWIDATDDDVFYANLNTSTDGLTGPVTVIALTSTTSGIGVNVGIAKAQGGNILVVYNIDSGTEEGAEKSTDGGATFGAIANPGEGAGDWFIALPGDFVDTQDMVLMYWDVSANEISYKIYDDSLDSWAETSVSTGMADATTIMPQWAAVVRLSDQHVILVAWNAYDVGTADFQCWDIIPGTSVTAKTDVVTNIDDCACAALLINSDNDHLFAFYCGKSDGSQVIGVTVGVYYKVSTDGGTTWGAEAVLFDTYLSDFAVLAVCPISASPPVLPLAWWDDTWGQVLYNAGPLPRAAYVMGVS